MYEYNKERGCWVDDYDNKITEDEMLDKGLCPVCGSHLIIAYEPSEAWGITILQKTEICPNGCY